MRWPHDETTALVDLHSQWNSLNLLSLCIGGDRHKHPKDLPVHSRLFVVHGKDTNESDLKEAFSDYGEVIENKIVDFPLFRRTLILSIP